MAEASSPTTPPVPTVIRAGGAPEGFDATLVLREAGRGDGPVVHVARDDKRAEAMARALAFFDPSMAVLRFPGWDCLPYDRVSPHPEVSATRMATLAALAVGLHGRFVLLTTLNAATQYVPPRDLLNASAFTAEVGGRIDEADLRAFLVRMGFVQTPTVTEPGDYAVRGGIIDVWPPGESAPVRRGDAAHYGNAQAGGACARLLGHPRRGCDHPVPAELPHRVRGGGHGRCALRGSERGPQAPGIGALAAVLPRAAGDDLRLPARRDGHARRPEHAAAPRAVGDDRGSIRHAIHGASPEGAARYRLQAGAARSALPR